MKTQHTPGPWIVSEDEILDTNGNQVAHINPFDRWDATVGRFNVGMPWRANAKLVAAAPEMFDALRDLYNASTLQSMPFDTAWQKAITLYEELNDQ